MADPHRTKKILEDYRLGMKMSELMEKYSLPYSKLKFIIDKEEACKCRLECLEYVPGKNAGGLVLYKCSKCGKQQFYRKIDLAEKDKGKTVCPKCGYLFSEEAG